MDIIIQRLLIGFGVNLLFGIIAFMREMVDDMGFFAGVTLFTLIYVFLDWQAYVIVVVFFMLTGAAIDIENRDKANKGSFELYKAKRPMARVLGRSLAGAVFAGLFFLTSMPEFKLAFVAAYAESIFDAISTKLGKLLSEDAYMITNFKTVHRGTPGAVSLIGTFFGMLAALIIAFTGLLIGLIKMDELFIIAIAALAGTYIDSLSSAYASQKRDVHNEFINFFGSLMAGLLAIWIRWMLV